MHKIQHTKQRESRESCECATKRLKRAFAILGERPRLTYSSRSMKMLIISQHPRGFIRHDLSGRRIYSRRREVWDLRREGQTVPSARQSITWSPPSSRRTSYPVGKQLPDQLSSPMPRRRVHERKREENATDPGDGNERNKWMKKERKNQEWLFGKQW